MLAQMVSSWCILGNKQGAEFFVGLSLTPLPEVGPPPKAPEQAVVVLGGDEAEDLLVERPADFIDTQGVAFAL